MKKPNKKKESAAIEELVRLLNHPSEVKTDIEAYVVSRMNWQSEEARKRREDIWEAWDLVCSVIADLHSRFKQGVNDLPRFNRCLSALLSIWPIEAAWITSQSIDLPYSEQAKLSYDEWNKRRSLPLGQITRLRLRGLPVLSLLNATPCLRPGIIRRCKRSGCTKFMTGWDRRDYCSKKCHPKREYDPSRALYQKVLMQAKRLAKTGTYPATIRATLVKAYGAEIVSRHFNLAWKFLNTGKKKNK